MMIEPEATLTLLELLLPSGRAGSALVVGSGCPPRLLPHPYLRATDGPVDLIVVAPTDEECRSTGWLADAVSTCGERLTPAGMAYVVVPRRRRRHARALLHARGLRVEQAIVHLPDLAESRHLVPLRRAPATFAFERIVPLVPWKRLVAGMLLGIGLARSISAVREGVALVARRPGATPVLSWLSELAQDGACDAVMTSSWRDNSASVVLHAFADGGGAPPVVAKLAMAAPGARDGDGEGARLSRLGADARRAGAAVPEPLLCTTLHGRSLVLESAVDGEILGSLLARSPARLNGALQLVCRWLARWHELTAQPSQLSRQLLDREVLDPAATLAPLLSGGTGYLDALRSRCAALEGLPVTLVAAHNDLTMWNLLVDRRGGLSVVDWEASEDATLPLKDFFYAAADAAAATERYADRLGAVRSCFAQEGPQREIAGSLQSSLAETAAVSAEVADLAFHACWLRHAANEQRSVDPSDARPFLGIVQWLVERTATASR